MKRTAIGVFLLLFTLIISVTALFITRSICENLQISAEAAEEAILKDDLDTAGDLADHMAENWVIQSRVCSLYMDHRHLERCEVVIHSLKKYLIIEDESAALLLCEELINAAKQLYTVEKPNIWNIF